MTAVTYSPVVGVQKAITKTIWQTIAAAIAIVIAFGIANPAIIATILGSWANLTVLEVVMLILNFIYNWLKNRGLGNA